QRGHGGADPPVAAAVPVGLCALQAAARHAARAGGRRAGMMARLGIALLNLRGRLPLPVLRALGAGIGHALYALAAPRRRVALRNLALCFPEVPERQRRAWARESFVVFCQTFLDRGWLWSAPEAVVRRRVKLVGAV